jgi:CMP-N-acetylneuraminic acid synthetase
MTAWGFVPARGGSKSIPMKNLVPLAGRPLLDYVVLAGKASGALSRLVCSTDSEAIAAHAASLGIEVDRRPVHLAEDSTPVDAVIREYLARERARGAILPDVVVLLQPTSPFLRREDVTALVRLFADHPDICSAHNVYPVPHNLHAWNHRSVAADGSVAFLFEAERSRARNKQEKPKLFAFGNLIGARTEALLSGQGFYAKPRRAIDIPWQYSFDLDQPDDLPMADAMLKAGIVTLDHLAPAAQADVSFTP